MCDRIVVLYAGEVMESGLAEDVFGSAAHPYTDALHRAALDPDPSVQRTRRQKLDDSSPAQSGDKSAGGDRCPFAPRCLYSQQRCWDERPPTRPTDRPSGQVACVRFPEWRTISRESRSNLGAPLSTQGFARRAETDHITVTAPTTPEEER
jgi:oligopeptide/dipeptide ABC transporter ATP-binding protein